MEKAIRNLILLVIVMALVTGGIYLFLNSRGVPGQEQNQGRGQEQGQEGEEAPPQEINFTESGNLIRNNPGMDPDVWYLVYEKPGQPALNVKLALDEASECNSATSAETDCGSLTDDMMGKRVLVEGFREDDTVLVVELNEL